MSGAEMAMMEELFGDGMDDDMLAKAMAAEMMGGSKPKKPKAAAAKSKSG